MSSVPVVEDDILGTVRLCRRCNEFWPFDTEFWYFAKGKVLGYCKACWSERDRSKYKGRYYTRKVA